MGGYDAQFLPLRFLGERFLESTPIHSLSFQPFYDTSYLSRHIKQRQHGVYGASCFYSSFLDG